MSYAAEGRNAIIALFEANRDALIVDGDVLDVSYANRPFTPNTDECWLRVTILDSVTVPIEIGNYPYNSRRTYGYVIVNVFICLGLGDGLAYELSDKVAQIFNSNQVVSFGEDVVIEATGEIIKYGQPGNDNKELGTVRFRAPEIETIGLENTPEPAFYQMNVNIPYEREFVVQVNNGL